MLGSFWHPIFIDSLLIGSRNQHLNKSLYTSPASTDITSWDRSRFTSSALLPLYGRCRCLHNRTSCARGRMYSDSCVSPEISCISSTSRSYSPSAFVCLVIPNSAITFRCVATSGPGWGTCGSTRESIRNTPYAAVDVKTNSLNINHVGVLWSHVSSMTSGMCSRKCGGISVSTSLAFVRVTVYLYGWYLGIVVCVIKHLPRPFRCTPAYDSMRRPLLSWNCCTAQKSKRGPFVGTYNWCAYLLLPSPNVKGANLHLFRVPTTGTAQSFMVCSKSSCWYPRSSPVPFVIRPCICSCKTTPRPAKSNKIIFTASLAPCPFKEKWEPKKKPLGIATHTFCTAPMPFSGLFTSGMPVSISKLRDLTRTTSSSITITWPMPLTYPSFPDSFVMLRWYSVKAVKKQLNLWTWGSV